MFSFDYQNIEIKGNFKLAEVCSLEVGNGALFFSEVDSQEKLKTALQFSKERALRVFFLGEGSNVLFSDRFFPFFVIKNKIKGISLNKQGLVEVFSGTPLSEFLNFLEDNELTGYEELSGIPGSVGGAVYGNAGAFGREIKDFLSEVISVTKNGLLKKRKRENLKFSYRWSSFKENGEFIYKIIFKLNKGNKEEIKKKREKIVEYRKNRLPENPPIVKSAGSFFKNILLPDGKKLAIGAILEKLGAKEMSVGGAAVSKKHANFLINTGNARAEDFIELARRLKRIVKEKEGFDIEEEVIILDNFF